MRITLKEVLEKKEYAPVPGTEFEVADNVVVKLRKPTFLLREEVRDIVKEVKASTEEDPRSDVKVARVVSEGAWPDNTDHCDPLMVAEVCRAFFRASGMG
jgi:hypothetical protein